jgi:16S rRNA G966 N2-methylase RsmD
VLAQALKSQIKPITLKVNPEYQKLVTPLSTSEYNDLKSSIENNGQWVDIVVNESGVILDGNNRYHILKDLDIVPRFTIRKFPSPEHEQLFIIDNNLKRRNLNPYQKGILILRKKPIYEELARLNRLKNLKNHKDAPDPTHKHLVFGQQGVNGKLASEAGLSHETIRKISIIQEKAKSNDIELLESGRKTVNKIFRKVMKEEKRLEFMQMKPVIDLPDRVKLICNDFRKAAKNIPDNSIDLIFSDLPYDYSGVKLYGQLAKVAQRVLKEGCFMVVYSGQYYLDQVMDAIKSNSDLRYWWMLASKLNHYHGLVFRRNVYSSWKPILIYLKGNKPRYVSDNMEDFIKSPEPKKTVYKFEQSVSEAEFIIKHLTIENQIVLDVCCGSATSGVSALKLNRQYVGVEKSHSAYLSAKKRLQLLMEIRG